MTRPYSDNWMTAPAEEYNAAIPFETVAVGSLSSSLSTLTEGLEDRIREVVLRTLDEVKTQEPIPVAGESVLAVDGSYVLRGEDASDSDPSRGVSYLSYHPSWTFTGSAGAAVGVGGAFVAAAVGSRMFYVDEKGSDTTGDGSKTRPFSSIARANQEATTCTTTGTGAAGTWSSTVAASRVELDSVLEKERRAEREAEDQSRVSGAIQNGAEVWKRDYLAFVLAGDVDERDRMRLLLALQAALTLDAFRYLAVMVAAAPGTKSNERYLLEQIAKFAGGVPASSPAVLGGYSARI